MSLNRKRLLSEETISQSSQRFEFKAAWAAAPHPEKAWKGGQDAIFASPNVLVVADGVSAWAKRGIDAGIYARRLISEIKQLIEGPNQLYFIEHPDQLALKAVQQNQEKGSSTLSILTVHPMTGIVRSFYVGDSIFGIFKRNRQHVLALEQQSTFDTPYQVYGGKKNIVPPSPLENFDPCDVFKGLYSEFEHSQVRGATIVLATDGLWDNIHIEEINEVLELEEVEFRRKSGVLIEKAMAYCSLPEYASPYHTKGVSKGLKVERKGKLDDVTIIVAQVITFTQ